MEKETFKPKMRITLLNDNGTPISDRLVDSSVELSTGAKVKHPGPIRVEITLQHKQDIDLFKTYLDQLSGDLPLKAVSAGRGRPSKASDTALPLNSPREDILQEVEDMVSKGKNQKDVIKYLRDLGFVFILTEEFKMHFPEFNFRPKDIGEPSSNGQYLNSLSWMVRRLKEGKDPRTDKYDPQIIFGFSIINGPSKKVVPYLYKEAKKPLKVAPSKKSLSFSNVGFTKYPPYMTEEERFKFSLEIRQLLNNKEKKPSKFWLRWYKDVIFPDNIKDAMVEVYQKATSKNV